MQIKNYKLKKVVYFSSYKINSRNFLKKILQKTIRKSNIYKIALFSCVVPKYQFKLKSFLAKSYKVKFKEIKDKDIKKIVKINIKNKLKLKNRTSIFVNDVFSLIEKKNVFKQI